MYHASKRPSLYDYVLKDGYRHYSKSRYTGKHHNKNWGKDATKFDQLKSQNKGRSTSSDR